MGYAMCQDCSLPLVEIGGFDVDLDESGKEAIERMPSLSLISFSWL